jgi:hypothetical protein
MVTYYINQFEHTKKTVLETARQNSSSKRWGPVTDGLSKKKFAARPDNSQQGQLTGSALVTGGDQ